MAHSTIEISLNEYDRRLLERFVKAVETLAEKADQPQQKLPNLIGD